LGSFNYSKTTKHRGGKLGKIDAPLNKKLQNVEWGEYKIEDVLRWQSQKEIDPLTTVRTILNRQLWNAGFSIITEANTNGGMRVSASASKNVRSIALKLEELKDETEMIHPFYGQATINHGIISYHQLTNKVLNNENGKPTILIHSNNQNIVYLETPFYLKDGHGATSVLQSEKLNKINQMFIVASIDKVIKSKYSYNNKATKIELKNTLINLPTKNGKIDFEFMESFIAELEAEHIAELEAYLLAAGLKDYTLTDEEKQILDDFEKGKIEFSDFRIEELFEINSYKKRFDANKVVISEIGKPYVVRTSLNNGVRGHINEDEEFLNEGNTISFGQDTATMFYQEKPYFTGDKIKILKSKDKRFNKLNGLFFISTMVKSFSSFSWGGSSFNVRIIENQLIHIPTKNKQPNYAIMEIFISAIQKLVIKDVVLYAERKISTKKGVVNQKALKK